MLTTIRCATWLVAALTTLAIGTAAPAANGAEADGARIAGAWTITVDVVEQNLPGGLAQRSGRSTYLFGEECVVGAPCQITRTEQDGRTVPATLVAGDALEWRTETPLDCIDQVTGAVSTPHGADLVIVATLRPTGTETRDGVQWVTGLHGALRATATINAAGRADGCLIRPQNTLRESDRAVLTGVPVPLAAPAPAGPSGPIALEPPAATRRGTLPGFTLPLTEHQQESRLAVDEGRRSSVPGSLLTPVDAAKTLADRLPENLLLLAALGLLMVFPAQIFNSTYEENHERIDRRLRGWWRRGAPKATSGRGRRLAVFAACLVAGSLLGGLLDPGFGTNRPSYALLAGVLLSVLAGIGVAIAAGIAFRGTTHADRQWYLRAIPSALVVAVLCVVVSRAVGFQPGYLYGLLGGAVFVAALDRRSEGRAEIVATIAALVLVALAWTGSGPVSAAANEPGASFLTLTGDAFLGALFIGGLEGVMFSLIPLRFLPGYRIKNASWVVWGVLTAVVVFTFLHVILRPASGYLGRPTEASVTTTLLLFAGFALTSVLFWGYFRLRPEPGATADVATPEAVVSEPSPPVEASRTQVAAGTDGDPS